MSRGPISRVRRVVKTSVWAARSVRLSASFADARAFMACRRETEPGPAVRLMLRGIPVPLYCRPGTTDPDVLWDTFGEGLERPSAPLPPGATILDLGANVGYTAVDFALHYPGARIVAVELDAANAALAEQNLAPFGDRCSVLQAAVWSHDGQITYGGDEAWGLQVVGDSEEGLCAPAVRMSTLIRSLGLDRIDYVKMDIEGSEAEAFSDPGWMDRVEEILVEVHPPGTPDCYETVLRSAGFRVCRFDHHGAPHVRGLRGA